MKLVRRKSSSEPDLWLEGMRGVINKYLGSTSYVNCSGFFNTCMTIFCDEQ